MARRKLKSLASRRPKKVVSNTQLTKSVAKSTGFTYVDVDYVIDEYLKKVKLELLDRKCVRINHVGLVYPLVRPPRPGKNMGGYGDNGSNYEPLEIQPKWIVRFLASKSLTLDVGGVMVTKRDLNNIYEK
tara:strand:- start:1594 stop:1983 length:390 start_codon:yes stop_codon:yes gene_type:complete